jgi:hypothetical protein
VRSAFDFCGELPAMAMSEPVTGDGSDDNCESGVLMRFAFAHVA